MIEFETIFALTHRNDDASDNYKVALLDLANSADSTAATLASLLSHAMQSDDHPVPSWLVRRVGAAIRDMGELSAQVETERRR